MKSSRCSVPGRVACLLPALFALLALVGGARPAEAIQLQSWVAIAQIMSGNTTLTESPAPPSPSGPDVSTGFLFDLGFTQGASSTLDEATSSAQVSSVAAGIQGLSASDNRIFEALDTGTFIQNGLFLAPHHAEYLISSTVGASFEVPRRRPVIESARRRTRSAVRGQLSRPLICPGSRSIR